jgi:hypothetical protein
MDATDRDSVQRYTRESVRATTGAKDDVPSGTEDERVFHCDTPRKRCDKESHANGRAAAQRIALDADEGER